MRKKKPFNLNDVIANVDRHGCELKHKKVRATGIHEFTVQAGSEILKFGLELFPEEQSAFFSPVSKKGFNSRVIRMPDLKRKLSSVCKKLSNMANQPCAC